MCLENIIGDFPIKIKKIGLNGCVYDFSVHTITDININIIDTHKYLMKKYDLK